MRPINVLALFDGMSCGQLALKKAGIPVARYYASEIDKHAIKVTQANFPDTVQLGDVTQIDIESLPHIDLILAGSPCQGFSFAGDKLAFDDPRSKLFFDFVRILDRLEEKNPDILFMLENVRMRAAHLDIITDYVGVDPVLLNSSLVSAQHRERYYWSNWRYTPPADAGLRMSDILETDPDPKYRYAEKSIAYMERGNAKWGQAGSRRADNYTQDRSKEKSFTLTANMHKGVPYNYFEDEDDNGLYYRKLTPVECERLQTVPDNYTAHVSDTQRYKMLGNGWTVDMIAHILRGMPL